LLVIYTKIITEQPDSPRQRPHNLHWNIPIATCTADNSWRRTQKMPETCTVSWQNKILDTWCILLVIYTKIITEQPDSPRQRPHNLHETYQLSRVQLITPDDGHRRCPKHVQFRDKIKFWMLDASCCLFIRRLANYSGNYMKYETQLSCKSTEFVMAQQIAHTVTCVFYRIKDNFSTT
jgi:hypothetical protein